jgi:predicted dinucleotide-binding enzyme
MTGKIGILGSGQVAQTLGAGFIKHGYSVMVGSRHPSKLEEWKQKTGNVQTGSFEEAADFGNIVVLAVKGTAAEELVGSVRASLSGKTVLDATNPIAEAPPENGVLKFFTTLDDSLLERLQRLAPEANFVKAFNSVGSVRMINPKLESRPTMFICGNNDKAKEEAKTILDQFGWDTADMGKAQSARAIEPLCILWCIPGFLKNQWTHAFKLLNS